MSKSMLVTLPFVLLLLDYWPLGRLRETQQGAAAGIAWRRLGGLCTEKLPLFAMAAAASWLALLGQRAAGAVVPIEALPLAVRLANAMQAYVAYIWSALWPAGLAVYYPHTGFGVSIPLGLLAGALVAGVTALVVVGARRFPYLAVGWLWYLGMLVPVIGLVQVGAQSMADRYTYLPLSGLFVAAVWGLAELARGHPGERLLAWAGAFWVAVLALVCWAQVAHWKDSVALFERALAVTSNNEVIHYHYGVALFELRDLEGAVVQLERAMLLNPANVDARATLGRVRVKQGRAEQAEEQFRAALELRPRDAELHFRLGSLLVERGADEEAIGHLREALLANPTFAEARLRLARALARLGRGDEARVEVWTLLQADPANRKASRMLRELSRGTPAARP
jgi:tetratricopeptide (TPR) repeat protein